MRRCMFDARAMEVREDLREGWAANRCGGEATVATMKLRFCSRQDMRAPTMPALADLLRNIT